MSDALPSVIAILDASLGLPRWLDRLAALQRVPADDLWLVLRLKTLADPDPWLDAAGPLLRGRHPCLLNTVNADRRVRERGLLGWHAVDRLLEPRLTPAPASSTGDAASPRHAEPTVEPPLTSPVAASRHDADGPRRADTAVDPTLTSPTTASAHDLASLSRAHHAGARLALLSPVHPPGCKPGPGMGLDAFAALVAQSPLPVAALGGVTPDNAADLRAVGAVAVASLSAWADANVAQLVAGLRG